MWRVVSRRWATLTEIYEHWSLVDLWDANEVITAIDNAEAEARKR